jgi:hypothetical protein
VLIDCWEDWYLMSKKEKESKENKKYKKGNKKEK